MKGKVKASFRTRSWRAGAYSIFAAVIVIAIAVVANLAVNAMPASVTQLDMTASGLYSLTEGTEQILASLDRDVDIYWLVQEGYENPTMEQVLQKYAEFDRVSVTKVDPVRYPGFAADYTDAEVAENSTLVVCGDRSMYIPYGDMWTYSDYDTYAYYMTYMDTEYLDVFSGESKLTSAVNYVTHETLPVMYYLTGHGETGVSDSVLDAIALNNIETKSLNLLTEKAVPEDCAVLALFGPVEDLTDREAELIAGYAAGGGQLLVTTAYTAEPLPNFHALLTSFGVDLLGGYVMESDSRYYSYGYIDLVLPAIGRHEVTAPLTRSDSWSVVMPDCQAMTLTDDPDVTVTPLLTSSATSYVKLSLEGLSSYDKAEGDPEGSYVLAAAAENGETGGRLVVFGSTRFMEADFSDMVSGANLDLFLNAADWLGRLEDSISIHPKQLTADYLTFDGVAAGVLKVALPIAVPLLFLAAGLVIFIRRRRR